MRQGKMSAPTPSSSLKNINGALGSSIRVSEPPSLGGVPVNDGRPDVAETAGDGTILFSNDGSRIFSRGDLDTNGIFDLWSVDTTAKAGLVPSAFTFVGPSGGDFFDENNWQDAQGNVAPSGTINPATTIAQSLVIPANKNVAAQVRSHSSKEGAWKCFPAQFSTSRPGISAAGRTALSRKMARGLG